MGIGNFKTGRLDNPFACRIPEFPFAQVEIDIDGPMTRGIPTPQKPLDYISASCRSPQTPSLKYFRRSSQTLRLHVSCDSCTFCLHILHNRSEGCLRVSHLLTKRTHGRSKLERSSGHVLAALISEMEADLQSAVCDEELVLVLMCAVPDPSHS